MPRAPHAPTGDPQIAADAVPATDVDPAVTPTNQPAVASKRRVERTSASTTYVGIGAGLLVLVVVLIFIGQNLNDARVHFFTADFSFPLGLVILASVVAGGLIVMLASAVRVLQLRRAARRPGN